MIFIIDMKVQYLQVILNIEKILYKGISSTVVFNENTDLNGKYLICDDPDCLPSGKAYIMGDVRIWPDKQ
jgi:hypothetical protein